MSARAGGSLLASSPLDSKSAGERWGLAAAAARAKASLQPLSSQFRSPILPCKTFRGALHKIGRFETYLW